MSLAAHALRLVHRIARPAMLGIFSKDRIATNAMQFAWLALVLLIIAQVASVAIILMETLANYAQIIARHASSMVEP